MRHQPDMGMCAPSKNFAASPKPNATTSNAPSAPKSADAPNENVRRRSDPLYRPKDWQGSQHRGARRAIARSDER